MDPLKAQAAQPESKLHFLDYWRIIRVRKTVILAVFLLVVITATLVTFILPEAYASTAKIKVANDTTDVSGLTDRGGYLPGYDPYFILTEFEVIQSEVVLDRVIKDLDLNTVWGKKYNNGQKLKTQETMSLIKGRMDLRQVRSTSLIEIRMFSEDKDEAAVLANKIAEKYRDYRLDLQTNRTQAGIDTYEERYKEQEAKVAELQTLLDKQRKELKISEYDAAGTAPTPLLETEVLRNYQNLYVNGTMEVVDHEKRLEALKDKTKEQLREVLRGMVSDSILVERIGALDIADQQLIRLRKDYGSEHPDVVKAQAAVDDLEKKVDDSVSGIVEQLKIHAEIARAKLAALKASLENAEAQDREKAEVSRPYFNTKRELEEAIRVRNMIAARITAEEIQVKLPRSTVVELVESAVPEDKPVKPNKTLNIAMGVIIGLVVGIGLAFFIEYLDTSVKTIDDVERTLGSPVLGVIPQNVGYLIEEGAESPHAEAYRVLRTNLLFSRKDEKHNTIAVVSAGAGEGKSTTIFNMATVFAQSDQRVILVDSDLRRPTLHKLLRVTNNRGLTNYLLKQNTLDEVIQTTSLPKLDFMASGKLPSSSLGILSSTQMRDLINELKQRYDFVFLDSPPIMGVSDASILASEVDMTLQVIQYRRYPQPMNLRAKQLIEKVGGNLIGIVLNNINMSQDESYYYYSGYYHDYYSKNEDSEPVAAGAGDKAKVDIKRKF
jgi:capsular exopolysaccharide synthesis family protein